MEIKPNIQVAYNIGKNFKLHACMQNKEDTKCPRKTPQSWTMDHIIKKSVEP